MISNLENNKCDVIENQWKCKLPYNIKAIFASVENREFVEGKTFIRALSLDEIANSSNELLINFQKLGLVPLLDLCDNDYVVYHIKENCWYKFNIVDEILFDRQQRIIDYFHLED